MAIRAWVITDDYELIACGAPPTDWEPGAPKIIDRRTCGTVAEEEAP